MAPQHSAADGVAGDLSSLSIAEEESARAKQHERDAKHGFTGGRGGAGNFHHASAAAADDDSSRGRGRASEGGPTKQHGVVGSILRSLSRATRDKEERKK